MQQQQQSQLGVDEVVWTLLLENWEPLDQAVVCKLLCCSQAMARLVHRTCAGGLSAEMLSLQEVGADLGGPASKPVPPLAERWLLRNARLLGFLQVYPHESDWYYPDDEPVAAGFAAARSAAAAAAARVAGRGKAAGLPLQWLVCSVPSRGHILCSLAGFTPHLTCLSLCVAEGWRPVSGCGAAFASLTSLRELSIGGKGEDQTLGPDTPVFNELAPALQHLTRLTALDLAPGRYRYDLGLQEVHGSHLQLLPACLVDLAVPLNPRPRADEPVVDMGHLKAVTKLHVENFQAGYVLPPNVEVLTLFDSVSLLPLFERAPPLLRHLSLLCRGEVFEVSTAARLQQLSQVTSLDVSVHAMSLDGLDDFVVLSKALPCLQELVVRSPTVIAPIAAIASACRQLTNLTFHAMCEGPAVRALAAYPSQLAGLRRLQWTAVSDKVDQYGEEYDAQPFSTQAAWQALCVAVAKLQPLRQVLLVDCKLGAAAAKLGAATQLTQLALLGCGDEATRMCSPFV